MVGENSTFDAEATPCRFTSEGHAIVNADCLDVHGWWDTIFLDPPDNIGLKYDGFEDRFDDYEAWLESVISHASSCARCVWVSFNSRWVVEMSHVVRRLGLNYKMCVQTFTFGQHNNNDLGNNHRPLWRLWKDDLLLFPDAIRVKSWRQENGDKRASPLGRVPGDVFDPVRERLEKKKGR